MRTSCSEASYSSYSSLRFACRALLLAVLLLLPTAAHAEETGKQAYLGVRLAPGPVPELLATHLRLEPGLGLVVADTVPGGPADQAGIVPTDLIVSLQGAPVRSYEQFASDLRAMGVGGKVVLGVIHEGTQRTVEATLQEAPEAMAARPRDLLDPWGPGAPAPVQPGWPGLDPLQRDPSLLFKLLEPQGDAPSARMYTERVAMKGPQGDEVWEITVEGDPAADDTTVSIRHGGATYEVTVKDLAALPENVRKVAREVLDRAAASVRTGPSSLLGPGLQSPLDAPGFFGGDAGSLWERLQQERQRMLDELMRRQPQPGALGSPEAPLRPVPQGIRS